MSDRIAHRFVASWTQQPAWPAYADSALDAAGRSVLTSTPRAVEAVVAAAEPDDALQAVLRLAKQERLPTFHRAVSFASSYGLLVDHLDEVGAVLETTGDGRTFTATGWIRPEHFVTVAALAHVSPALWITAAEIGDFDGQRMLIASADCIELSAVSDAALAGTTFSLSGPEHVPDWDWARLGWDLPAGYHRDPGDTLRWSAAMADRQEVADHRGIVCKAE